MKTSIETPYFRYALIAKLATLCKSRNRSLGRTALQKYVYLLQALFHMDCGYEFQLYTYGPFCSELLSDLDFATAAQIVDVGHSTTGYGGYQISSGSGFNEIKRLSGTFLEDHEDKISQLFTIFGNFTAKELELRATVVFCDRDCESKGKHPIRSDFISLVHEIKPGFSEREIEAAINELEEGDYIQKRQEIIAPATLNVI